MAHWYYAKDDQQHGPISDEEIEALVAAGTVSPTDEVWRDGMGDWKPAGQVPELFANPLAGEQPVAPPPMPSAVRRGGFDARSALRWLDFDVLQMARPLGQWLLIGGFLMVIGAKGCGAIGERNADRTKAQASLASDDFNHEYDLRQANLELDRDRITAKPEITEYDQSRLETIDKSLVELEEDRTKEQTRLRRTTWQTLQHNAASADAELRQSALWHTMLFVLGSMVLAVGLLIVGLTSQGAPSWLCLTMLAIMAFSLYIFGATWAG